LALVAIPRPRRNAAASTSIQPGEELPSTASPGLNTGPTPWARWSAYRHVMKASSSVNGHQANAVTTTMTSAGAIGHHDARDDPGAAGVAAARRGGLAGAGRARGGSRRAEWRMLTSGTRGSMRVAWVRCASLRRAARIGSGCPVRTRSNEAEVSRHAPASGATCLVLSGGRPPRLKNRVNERRGISAMRRSPGRPPRIFANPRVGLR